MRPAVIGIGIPAPGRRESGAGGEHPTATHLPGGFVEAPLGMAVGVEETQLGDRERVRCRGAGAVRVAVLFSVHGFTMPRWYDSETADGLGLWTKTTIRQSVHHDS